MSKDDKIVFCTGGGCTAKLGAGVLSRILEKLPRGEKDPDLLVGYDSRDDAAVYRITDNIALVQTVDFFPPNRILLYAAANIHWISILKIKLLFSVMSPITVSFRIWMWNICMKHLLPWKMNTWHRLS